MTLEQAIRQLNKSKPAFGKATRDALDVVIEETKPGITLTVKLDEGRMKEMIHDAIRDFDDCEGCLRQGCEYRDPEVVRVNCPLLKTSAV